MGVLDRLRRITGEEKKDSEKSRDRSAEIGELRQRIETVMTRRPLRRSPASASCPPLQEVISGEEILTEKGAFFLATEERASHHCHGNRLVGELTRPDMAAAALLANNPAITACSIHDALFLDTETTGLSGGTGTLAFMIGLGWFEKDAFITRQIFIRDYGEERAALHYLAEIAKTKSFLVSFNGKAFDVNLLSSRFILNRMRNPLESLPHLDLLFPSRRLCGYRLENSRLVTLEQHIIGLTRDNDIPGMEIPERYFAWLRRRDPRLIADIFRHNHLDILSLAALLVHLAELIVPCSRDNHPGGDLLAAARLLRDRGKNAAAVELLGNLTGCDQAPLRSEAQKLLSLTLKRQGEWTKAALIWEEMLNYDPGNLFAVIELAKWQEHVCRNYQAAHDLLVDLLAKTLLLTDREREALDHRRQRLHARLTRRETGDNAFST